MEPKYIRAILEQKWRPIYFSRSIGAKQLKYSIGASLFEVLYWNQLIGDTLLEPVYWRYSIGTSLLEILYWSQFIEGTLMKPTYWRYSIGASLLEVL